VAALALVSCSTQPPVDPLEAKARDGDPAAACQLVVRSLHTCALEKQKWETGQLAARPACVDRGISKQEQGYLDKADASLKGQQLNQLLFTVDRLQLATAAVLLQAGQADQVITTIDKLQETCAVLASPVGRKSDQEASGGARRRNRPA
jgi:hypothetical protein